MTLLFLPADNCTTIDFVRHDKGDFADVSSILDLHIREELVGRKPVIENDEDLLPQRIESVTLDGIEHRNEILLLVQIVRSIDRVDALVVVD